VPRAFRLIKAKYAAEAFTGDGARRYGGRWNTAGTPVVYASSSIALAILEVLVNLEDPAELRHYLLAEAGFEKKLLRLLDSERLPASWRDNPAPPEVVALGQEWLASASSAVLDVPSAVVAEERNYLLNPRHGHFGQVTLLEPRSFAFDPRLGGGG
jgi:RES domain-containing protein